MGKEREIDKRYIGELIADKGYYIFEDIEGDEYDEGGREGRDGKENIKVKENAREALAALRYAEVDKKYLERTEKLAEEGIVTKETKERARGLFKRLEKANIDEPIKRLVKLAWGGEDILEELEDIKKEEEEEEEIKEEKQIEEKRKIEERYGEEEGIEIPYKEEIRIERIYLGEAEKEGEVGIERGLKVPLAIIGKWEHPRYGRIEFKEKDFKEIVRNYKNNVTGYEPALYIGHSKGDDTPAAGFLENMYYDNNVLYGEYKIVDKEAYNAVVDGKYRYSSAELIRNAKGKEDGKEIGAVLVGAALTNRPFLTRMPRVETLSEEIETEEKRIDNSSRIRFYIDSKEKDKKEEEEMEEKMNKRGEEMETEVVEKESKKEKEIEEKLSEMYAEKFIVLAQQIEEARAKAERAEAMLQERELEERKERIKKLNLSQMVKDEYIQMLSDKVLGEEQQKRVEDMLYKLSEQNSQETLVQIGSTEETENMNRMDKEVNPYERILRENEKKFEQIKLSR